MPENKQRKNNNTAFDLGREVGKDKNRRIEREKSSPSGTVKFTQNIVKQTHRHAKGLQRMELE
jgi:hypothetical protein